MMRVKGVVVGDYFVEVQKELAAPRSASFVTPSEAPEVRSPLTWALVPWL